MTRMEDFTIEELFPRSSYTPLHYGSYVCKECGALAGDMVVHVQWHNKLLP